MQTKKRIAAIAGSAALIAGSLFVGSGAANADDYGGGCTETAPGTNIWHCHIFTNSPEAAEREAQRARDLGGQNVHVFSPFEGGWDTYSYWTSYPRINL